MGHSKIVSMEMTAASQKNFDKVLAHLRKFGLLLLSDAALPNVAELVANEKMKGSWWSHKSAQAIFNVSERLEDHADVLIMKLISDKVTFVHRKLWGHVYSIGVAREEWQTKKLPAEAKWVVMTLDAEGSLHTNKLGKKYGETVRELERRMLIHASQIHTESGAHAKIVETWDTWAERVKFRVKAKSAEPAKRFFEKRLKEMNEEFGGAGWLPWRH